MPLPSSSLVLLDGSTGHELKARGVLASFEGAMLANLRQPDVVTAIHAEYVDAGCDIVTTNTFTLTPDELARQGRGAELAPLLHAACGCARAAADAAAGSRAVRVAGCLPPLQHCYLPELVKAPSEMVRQYEQIARELAPRVDLFLCETLCHSSEAIAALQATATLGKPVWTSFTLHDQTTGPPTLRGDEYVGDAVAALENAKLAPQALLYNCCAPQVLTMALRQTLDKLPESVERLGGYANGFQSTTSQWLNESGASQQGCSGERHNFACPMCAANYDGAGCITSEAYRSHAIEWVESGASVVGGCCGVGPRHMRAIAEWRDRKCLD